MDDALYGAELRAKATDAFALNTCETSKMLQVDECRQIVQEKNILFKRNTWIKVQTHCATRYIYSYEVQHDLQSTNLGRLYSKRTPHSKILSQRHQTRTTE